MQGILLNQSLVVNIVYLVNILTKRADYGIVLKGAL